MAHRGLVHHKDPTKLTIEQLRQWLLDAERFQPHTQKELLGKNKAIITARYLLHWKETNG